MWSIFALRISGVNHHGLSRDLSLQTRVGRRGIHAGLHNGHRVRVTSGLVTVGVRNARGGNWGTSGGGSVAENGSRAGGDGGHWPVVDGEEDGGAEVEAAAGDGESEGPGHGEVVEAEAVVHFVHEVHVLAAPRRVCRGSANAQTACNNGLKGCATAC